MSEVDFMLWYSFRRWCRRY